MYSNRKERAELLKALVDDELTPAKYSQVPPHLFFLFLSAGELVLYIKNNSRQTENWFTAETLFAVGRKR
jgi:hypothetical protein